MEHCTQPVIGRPMVVLFRDAYLLMCRLIVSQSIDFPGGGRDIVCIMGTGLSKWDSRKSHHKTRQNK